MNWLFVFLGGMTGATLRFLVQSLFTTYVMLCSVNVLGSILLGCLNGIFSRKKNVPLQLFFTTGMLGAFTTFSTFSEGWLLLLKENLIIGLIFGLSMTICCFLSAYLGFRLLRGEN